VKTVLNVGGGNKSISLPEQYSGWKQVLLDINARYGPDLVLDARELSTLPGGEYDAVFCSHSLEHFYPHDVSKVLAGFLHVLKDDGFAQIRVPDVGGVMHKVVQSSLDIDDVLFQSHAGPITVRDVIYGYSKEIEKSGTDFYAHKTGFTQKSLTAVLHRAGFAFVYSGVDVEHFFEITALAFKRDVTEYAAKLFKIPRPGAPG